MEPGDLVEIVEDLPGWEWLSFKTGDIGIVREIRDYGPLYDYRIIRVYLPRTDKIESIPEHFLIIAGAEL